MPNKRLITGRDGDTPPADATVETYGTGVPRPREASSDKNQLRGKMKHGTTKGKKVHMKDKTQ